LEKASRGDSSYHVYVLTRRKEWLVRDFDVPVHWVDRWTEKYTAVRRDFAARPFAERAARIRSVREGGSIPPAYFELLLAEQAKGRLTLLSGAEIKQADLNEAGVSLLVESGHGQLQIQALEVVLATGTQLAVDRIPCFEWLRRHRPIGEYGGAPAIQADLRWAPGIDAFFLGAYGALQLGPDAANLAGARRGSRAVARELWEARLRRWSELSKGGRAPAQRSGPPGPAGEQRASEPGALERPAGRGRGAGQRAGASDPPAGCKRGAGQRAGVLGPALRGTSLHACLRGSGQFSHANQEVYRP